MSDNVLICPFTRSHSTVIRAASQDTMHEILVKDLFVVKQFFFFLQLLTECLQLETTCLTRILYLCHVSY